MAFTPLTGIPGRGRVRGSRGRHGSGRIVDRPAARRDPATLIERLKPSDLPRQPQEPLTHPLPGVPVRGVGATARLRSTLSRKRLYSIARARGIASTRGHIFPAISLVCSTDFVLASGCLSVY